MDIYEIKGLRIAELPADGPELESERDATDIIGDLYGSDADYVALPVSRLTADFWVLKTKLAGHFIQKLQNYHLRVAFIGDLAAEIAASGPLRDYVTESNRRKDVIFARDRAELEALL